MIPFMVVRVLIPLQAGGGADKFLYDGTEIETDEITDFDKSQGDQIGLLTGVLKGNFSYMGAGSFTGGTNASAIFDDATNLLSIDTNGDGNANLTVTMTGVSASDLDDTAFDISATLP